MNKSPTLFLNVVFGAVRRSQLEPTRLFLLHPTRPRLCYLGMSSSRAGSSPSKAGPDKADLFKGVRFFINDSIPPAVRTKVRSQPRLQTHPAMLTLVLCAVVGLARLQGRRRVACVWLAPLRPVDPYPLHHRHDRVPRKPGLPQRRSRGRGEHSRRSRLGTRAVCGRGHRLGDQMLTASRARSSPCSQSGSPNPLISKRSSREPVARPRPVTCELELTRLRLAQATVLLSGSCHVLLRPLLLHL